MPAVPALHLLKLCVGCDSIADLEGWIAENRAHARRLGRPYEQTHTTRMMPKRQGEIAGRGSLYWVIKGTVACRQSVRSVTPFVDTDGIGRCRLVLQPEVVPVAPRPCRPFQGWRYLEARDAPGDLTHDVLAELGDLPEPLRRDLVALGLI